MQEKGWNNRQEYTKLLNYHNVDTSNLNSAKSLFRKAEKFWVSERYDGLNEEKGKIIFIHPKGKLVKIKVVDGNVYNFHKRDFISRQSNLSVLNKAEVTFIVMNSYDDKQVAENINVLKTENNPISEQVKVGTVIKGTVKNIAAFGIFVRLNEKEDGLLHKNALPDDLKDTFNERFTSGQKVKVKIIKVTDKGAQLKLQE